MTNLEMMINDYQAKKVEMKLAAATVLAPMWDAIVTEQATLKMAKEAGKKQARIVALEEELAQLRA